ncbi:ABC-type nickel/cobalt efflux system permease component RcnA [Hamadaea flava]|uniref:Sulfite exporter TauE/SafE family protein n=1 Tax=Hamadaea flava TaxID=1742688 RepID=A0ABV8LHM0_9ACTN|nr:sulfite exporter TauE/SafE family protein [Hamadaea flava]MCP2324276.1 ABC-type nickel/cobalt efflux system permease component RcnA [Hamadaea flava]
MIPTILLSAALAAHPLTPFSIDHLVKVTIHPDRVDVVAALDIGEVAAKQITPDCTAFAAKFDTRVDGVPVKWTVQSQELKQIGASGIPSSLLTCKLSAPATVGAATDVAVVNGYLADRTGASQILLAGDGVALPAQLPPYERSAQVKTLAVAGTATSDASPQAEAPPAASKDKGWLQRGEAWLEGVLGDPAPHVLLLAVLMAALLGAAHAALPGHGKTVMALYLAGRQGRRRDALIVGGIVTLTHTAGVLILGVATTTFAGLAAESVLQWLGVVSGVLITVVGLGILINALRHRRDHHHHRAHHHHHHDHPGSRRNLTVLGVAGGLVPSPTALVVLLGAAALGRLWFGIVLIIVYGLGMAGTLTAAGLLLLRVRDRWAWLGRLTVPAEATGSVIIVLGFGLAARAMLAL